MITPLTADQDPELARAVLLRDHRTSSASTCSRATSGRSWASPPTASPTYYDFLSARVLTMSADDDFSVNIRVLDHHMAKRYQFSAEAVRRARATADPGRRRSRERAPGHRRQRPAGARGRRPAPARRSAPRDGEENLCLAGGVAFNSVMNGRISQRVAVQEGVHPARRRATPAAPSAPRSALQPDSRPAPHVRDAPRVLRAVVLLGGVRLRPRRRRPALRDAGGRGACCPGSPDSSLMAASSVGSRAGWSSGPGLSGTGASSPTLDGRTCGSCSTTRSSSGSGSGRSPPRWWRKQRSTSSATRTTTRS